jgi:hypothetical protein
VLAVAVLAAGGCGGDDGGDVPLDERVAGHLELGCGRVACSDQDLAAALHGRDVYCYWDGDRVKIHLSLENGFPRRIEFSIAPVYVIERGGRHGEPYGTEGDASFEGVALDGGERKEVTLDAGPPLGVPEGAPIEECVPQLDRAVARD